MGIYRTVPQFIALQNNVRDGKNGFDKPPAGISQQGVSYSTFSPISPVWTSVLCGYVLNIFLHLNSFIEKGNPISLLQLESQYLVP